MTDTIVGIIATIGTSFVLMAGVGILRMPDTYLRMAVTTKAATLGIGLIMVAAAIYFNDLSTTTRVMAVIIFILITAPVGAHLIGKAAYITGPGLWKKTKMDDLEGKYRKTGKNFSLPRNMDKTEENS